MKSEYRFMEYGPFMCWLPWRQQIILWLTMLDGFAFLAGISALLLGAYPLLQGNEPNWIPTLAGYAAALTAGNAFLLLRRAFHSWQPNPKSCRFKSCREALSRGRQP